MKKIVVFILFLFVLMSSPKAADCSTKDKVSMASEAAKVTASYEYKTDENGAEYFLITVYNLSNNIFVSYKDESLISHDLYYVDNKDPSFKDYDLNNVVKYQFDIYILGSEGCVSRVRTFTMTKPKRNPFYISMAECRYEKMKDYYYCQEWISGDFKVDDTTIMKNIKNEYNKTTTTISYEIDDSNSNFVTFMELYIKYRIYILIGLGIGIAIDIVYIYLSYKKIKDAEF